MKIANVRHEDDGRWTWTADGTAYATNRFGEGMFIHDEYGFFNKQIVGTCQFVACKTVSGMRRKLNNWFNTDEED